MPKIKLTPHQKDALSRLAAHDGPMRWDELRAPGPTLSRLNEMGLASRHRIGATMCWQITSDGRAALGNI